MDILVVVVIVLCRKVVVGGGSGFGLEILPSLELSSELGFGFLALEDVRE